MRMALYRIDFRYRSNASWAFDRDHKHRYVEAPEGLSLNELDLYLEAKKASGYSDLDGYAGLNSFEVID